MQRSSALMGRLSGLTTMLGGLLWVAGGITALNASALGIGMRIPHLLLTMAGVCSLVGLGWLAGHGGQFGVTGTTGSLVAMVGVTLIIASKNLPSSTSDGAGWALFDVGGLLLVVGSLLFGSAAVRSRTWQFGGPLLAIGVVAVLQLVFMMVSSADSALGTVVLPALLGTAWIVLGYAMWAYRSDAVRQPSASQAPRDLSSPTALGDSDSDVARSQR